MNRPADATGGGGEVIIYGRDGRIRDKDTVALGRDPNPPREEALVALITGYEAELSGGRRRGGPS